MIQGLGLELPTYADIRRQREAELKGVARRRAKSRRAGAQARNFEGARHDRLTHDWLTTSTSTAWELRRDLRVLRARARHLARNDDYVKRFLSMVRSNVAGPAGVKLQARARDARGELDPVLNRAVETAWASWSHPENCSLSGRLSWADACRKFIGVMARDGESLVRTYAADNPFGFALRFYSADWLDETFCDINPLNGNRIVMSVEVDDFDRPVAYWLTPPPSEYLFTGARDRARTRVGASEIVHKFLADDECADDDSQARGVPWLHTAMKRLKILGRYEEAELIAAQIGASKMGFYKQTTADDEYTGDEDGEDGGKDSAAPLYETVEPGRFGVLEPGMDFVPFDADHPNAGYKDFVKAVLRGVAAGLDVTYFSLANDLEAVNYSSARIGLLQERDVWRALQNFLAEHFCRPVYLGWLKSSMLTGALQIGAAEYRRLTEPQWQARGWKWVDPLKEGQAHKLGIEEGWETLTGVIAEQGEDIEEVLDTRAREQKLLAAKGIELKPSAAAQGGRPPGETGEEEEDTGA